MVDSGTRTNCKVLRRGDLCSTQKRENKQLYLITGSRFCFFGVSSALTCCVSVFGLAR